jgi:uncharacterized protein (TIGR02444 family)
VTSAGTAEALWPYALEVYGRPGVEAMLLTLQDEHGQCVPLLLWSLWMAASGRPIEAPAAWACAELARAWQDAAVAPLRKLRRDLKGRIAKDHIAKDHIIGGRIVGGAARDPRLQARIRTGVQALELEAERMLLQMLEESSPPPADAVAAPADALGLAVRAWGGVAPPALLWQLAALCA